MKGSLGSTAGWILAIFWIVASLQRSDAIGWEKQPNDPTILVERVNNTAQSLAWEFNKGRDEIIQNVKFFRRPIVAGSKAEQLASRLANTAFTVTPRFVQEYNATTPSTLILRNVNNKEEFFYSIRVSYVRNMISQPDFAHEVKVIVYVPPTITKQPERKSEVSIGQNLTLTCESAGDPTPNITWTKDGVPQNVFNVSNTSELHLVHVQRENIGLYRCTASNIVGNATSVAIVTVACPADQCVAHNVSINLTSEVWKPAYSNPNAIEYKMLKSNLSAEIARIYTLPENADKQLYILNIVEFRSGSTIAVVHLYFHKNVSDPLKPLRDEIAKGNLGHFSVARQFVLINDSHTTTQAPSGSTGTPTSSGGLTGGQIGGIIGGSIAFAVFLIVIGLVYFFYSKTKKTSAKSKSYSEADGYRMNKHPPSSGLGTASPAYVEARMYAPPNAARRQDDAVKHPLPAGGGGGGGQDGQGGFEMWC